MSMMFGKWFVQNFMKVNQFIIYYKPNNDWCSYMIAYTCACKIWSTLNTGNWLIATNGKARNKESPKWSMMECQIIYRYIQRIPVYTFCIIQLKSALSFKIMYIKHNFQVNNFFSKIYLVGYKWLDLLSGDVVSVTGFLFWTIFTDIWSSRFGILIFFFYLNYPCTYYCMLYTHYSQELIQ